MRADHGNVTDIEKHSRRKSVPGIRSRQVRRPLRALPDWGPFAEGRSFEEKAMKQVCSPARVTVIPLPVTQCLRLQIMACAAQTNSDALEICLSKTRVSALPAGNLSRGAPCRSAFQKVPGCSVMRRSTACSCGNDVLPPRLPRHQNHRTPRLPAPPSNILCPPPPFNP